MKFYPRAWAKYSEAVSGSLKLLPPTYRFESLATAYDLMKNMLYGEIPSFEKVMKAVGELERKSTYWGSNILKEDILSKECWEDIIENIGKMQMKNLYGPVFDTLKKIKLLQPLNYKCCSSLSSSFNI